MAATGKVHYTLFPIVGTVNERGLILHVEEVHFKSSTVLASGTTLESFMSAEDIPKGDALTDGFGAYTYCEQIEKQGTRLRFVFLAPKTPTQQLQTVKPAFSINEVTYWPDWLLSLYMLEATVELQEETGTLSFSGTSGPTTNTVTGTRFLDRYILFKGGEFNTLHTVEEYFSSAPITNLIATEPRAQPVFYNYMGVRNSLEAIHAGVTIPEPYLSATLVEDFGTTNHREVVWENGSVFPPTNQTSWIRHRRKLIVTERDGGFYYRSHTVIPPRLNRAIQV
jgi:hypothetical protein